VATARLTRHLFLGGWLLATAGSLVAAEPVARIDGQPLHAEDIADYRAGLQSDPGRAAAMEELINRRLLLEAARERAKEEGVKVFHVNIGQPDIATPKEFMEFVRDQSVIASGKPKKETISSLRRIVDFVITHGLGEIYAAYSPENNLCASVLFLKSQRNACVLYSGISEDGIKLKAMELLIDLFIRNNAEKNITLSFENLAIPNKEKLFNGFGAGNYHYTTVKNPLNPFRIII